jgi:hypothetical protein
VFDLDSRLVGPHAGEALLPPKPAIKHSSPAALKCLDNLLRRPFGGGIRGNVEVDDATSGVTQNDEHEQQTESNSRYDEKVNTNHVWHVILDKGLPGLGRRFGVASAQYA